MEDYEIIEKEGKIVDYKEEKEYLQFNRFIIKDITKIPTKDILKILHFKEDDIFLVYQNKTFKDVYNECIKKKRGNS